MISEAIFDRAMSGLKHGKITVDFWGTRRKTYGLGEHYFTMHIKDPKALTAIVRQLDMGFGEAYMNGTIEIEGSLDQVMRLAEESRQLFGAFGKRLGYRHQRNVKDNQKKQIAHHYDLGNDFFRLWLDKSMTYTCAYFAQPDFSLEQAQAAKLSHVLSKLQLAKGQRLLDIGSGWGELLITAAKRFGAKGLGVTLSEEQLRLSREKAKAAGVDKLVKFELCNYLDLKPSDGPFDRVVSVGMFEAVGRNNLADYFKVIDRVLKAGGLSVLHTITQQTEAAMSPWIDKYIFPGGYIPSLRQTLWLLPEQGFRILDVENLRLHYALTLDEWLRRFEQHVDKVRDMYDERFVRMWRLYLASSSASFRYGGNDLSQIVFSKGLDNTLPLTRAALYN